MSTASPVPRPRWAIGIDVGGTKTAAGLVDSRGLIRQRRVIATRPERGGEAVLTDVLNLAEQLQADLGQEGETVKAVGLGVCELVDPRAEIVSAQTVAWRGWPVAERLGSIAPARVESDSRAAAFGEAHSGSGQPFRSFLYVTVGTGIGSSLVLDGKPFVGARGCTGTLATAPMTVWCANCRQPARAVLEEVASGPALVARFNHGSGQKTTRAEEVLAAAVSGDSRAVEVIETAALTLGATIGLLVNVLDPEAVVIGGGLGTAPGLFWERLVPAVRGHIWSDLQRDLPVLQGAHKGDAGLIGAALLALEAIEAQ